MRWHYRVWLRLRTMFRRGRVESELGEEVRLHIERMTEENAARGMSTEEARRAALVEFGGVEQVKEECRDARGVRWLEEAWQDLRFGMRQLRRAPGFTVVALITLTLGIGATTAIFSVSEAVLLRRPYRDAGRIVVVLERFPRVPGSAFVLSPEFRAWKERSRSFEEIGAYGFGSGANLTGIGEPVHVSVGNVTTGFFGVFGIQPVAGRGFVAAEARQGAAPVAMLSETLWRSRFGADPKIVGKTIRLDGEVYQVVGVAPGNVAMATADVWTPLALDSPFFSPHNPAWTMLQVWGRLKRGATAAEAKADLQVLTEQLNREYGVQSAQFRAGVRVDATPLHEFLVLGYGKLLEILLAAVGCLLLIACANVANLLLERGVVRAGETAVRAALGAGRWRLIRQSLAESLLLAAGGGAAGCAAGVWATRFLRQLVPEWLTVHVGMNWTVLWASAGFAIAALLVFGVAPAIAGARPEAGDALRHAGNHATGGRRRWQNWLPATEVALSLVLLIAAGLLVRSFVRLSNVPLGFDPHGVYVASVNRPVTRGTDPARSMAFGNAVLEGIRRLPGVEAGCLATQYPLGMPNNAALEVDVRGAGKVRFVKPAVVASISPDCFRVLRIAFQAGRGISDADAATAPKVAVVSEAFAREVFRGRGAVGQEIRLPDANATEWTEVVGVVADTRGIPLGEEPDPAVFTPFAQQPSFRMSFLVRAAAPGELAEAVRKTVLSVDRNQPLSESRTMDELVARQVAPLRFRMLLLGLFAVLAMTLAAVGVYGVVSYSCSRRAREFGIRSALGAGRREILGLVLRQAGGIAAVGVAVGLAGAFGATRLLSGFLYGTKPDDAATFFVVPAGLLAVALLAGYLPARRAVRLDPARLLREE